MLKNVILKVWNKIRNVVILYKQTCCSLLKTPSVYIAYIVSVLAAILMLVVIPAIQIDWNRYFDSNSWAITALQPIFVALAFSSALIGEVSSNSAEKVYVLSKTVKRSSYLWGKCLAALTFSLITMLTIYAMLLGINRHFMHLNNGKQIFREGITLVGFTFSMLMLTIFGTVISVLGKYFMRGGLCIIGCTIVVLIYTLVFTMFVFKNDTPNPDATKMQMELYTTILLPCILAVLTVICTSVFTLKFLRHTVES